MDDARYGVRELQLRLGLSVPIRCEVNRGRCEAFMAGHIEEGYFNDTSVDGLNYAALMYWPREVHEGNGTQQVIIDKRADPLSEKHCERSFTASRPPWSDSFFVYNAMMSTVLATLTRRSTCRSMSMREWPASRSTGWSSRVGRRSPRRGAQHCRTDTPQYAGWAALHLCRDGQRQHHIPGGNRAGLGIATASSTFYTTRTDSSADHVLGLAPPDCLADEGWVASLSVPGFTSW